MATENLPRYISIWIKPEKTIQTIIHSPGRSTYVLSAFFAFFVAQKAFIELMTKTYKGEFSATVVLFSILVGITVATICIFGGGHLLALIGSKLNGLGNHREIRVSIVWSFVPLITAIPFMIPKILLLISSNIGIVELTLVRLLEAAVVFQGVLVVLSIYSFGLLVRTLAVVHRYSKKKALYTVMITAFVIGVIIVVFQYVISMTV